MKTILALSLFLHFLVPSAMAQESCFFDYVSAKSSVKETGNEPYPTLNRHAGMGFGYVGGMVVGFAGGLAITAASFDSARRGGSEEAAKWSTLAIPVGWIVGGGLGAIIGAESTEAWHDHEFKRIGSAKDLLKDYSKVLELYAEARKPAKQASLAETLNRRAFDQLDRERAFCRPALLTSQRVIAAVAARAEKLASQKPKPSAVETELAAAKPIETPSQTQSAVETPATLLQ